MTSRTKRRLAVFGLALGLIAAARYDTIGARAVALRIGPFGVAFLSEPPESLLAFQAGVGPLPATTILHLPDESITLRVACAVALAGTWLLVLGGRLLARRWRWKSRTGQPSALHSQPAWRLVR